MKYRFGGKERRLSLGVYPDVGLKEARARLADARELLARAAALDAFAVVVEAGWLELAQGGYRSRLNPYAACQSVLAFSCRYRLPFLFAGSRAAAEYVTWGFLRQYLEGARRRFREIVRAHGDAA